jgi:hypothetical protein
MASHGRWEGLFSRLYYTLGSLYYVYHWVLLLGFGGVITAISSYLFYPSVFIIIPTLTLSLGAILLGGFYAVRNYKARYHGVNPGLNIIDVDNGYCLLDNDNYCYYRNINAMAKQHGVESYQHKFIWTGTGIIKGEIINSLTSGDSVQILAEKFGTNNICKYVFRQPLRKGESKAIGYKLTLHDEAKTMRPFFSTNINEPIRDKLTLKVKFLHTQTNRRRIEYTKAIFLSKVSDMPIWEEANVLQEGSNEVVWPINKPRVGYRYRITWSLNDT